MVSVGLILLPLKIHRPNVVSLFNLSMLGSRSSDKLLYLFSHSAKRFVFLTNGSPSTKFLLP